MFSCLNSVTQRKSINIRLGNFFRRVKGDVESNAGLEEAQFKLRRKDECRMLIPKELKKSRVLLFTEKEIFE